jgi:hypothetical protein
MVAKSMARHIHLVRAAQVAGEAFGYQALQDNGAEPARWARPTLALLMLGFLGTATYLAL